MSVEDRLAAVEARLGVLEDQEKIRRCLARYGFNADLGRSEEYLAIWSEDGLYDLDNGKLEGTAALWDMISSPTGHHKSAIENRSMHAVGNLFIEIDGDTAWAEGYSIVWVRGPNGHEPKTAADVVKAGDVVYVIRTGDTAQLAQPPIAQGALVAIDPEDGAITALNGGFDFFVSKFNRVIQARRQPGSAF